AMRPVVCGRPARPKIRCTPRTLTMWLRDATLKPHEDRRCPRIEESFERVHSPGPLGRYRPGDRPRRGGCGARASRTRYDRQRSAGRAACACEAGPRDSRCHGRCQSVSIASAKTQTQVHSRAAARGRARVPVNLYAESSAVLAWLLDETSAPNVRQLLAAAETVVASDLTLIECDRVLLRAAALGELTT